MRLSEYEQKTIRDLARETFGRDSRVFIFGSRVDDTRRGGDIDILIQTNLSGRTARARKIHYVVALKKKIGDREIDVVIKGNDSRHKPIFDVALEEGVELK
jgi:predicted nucleotidyltransferase